MLLLNSKGVYGCHRAQGVCLQQELVPVGRGRDDLHYRMTEYAYDGNGNRIRETRYGGRIRYAHNSMGLVCAVTDQCGNTETFRYDKEGRETEHTDRNGTVTETKYNLYGQPVLQSCTDKDGERQVMGAWEYDSFGQPTKAVAGGSCYTYEYRPDGKLLRKWSSGKLVEACTYYRYGSLRSLTDVSVRSSRRAG